jgi:tetratricopeptide (TPR) repeat protein
MIAATFGVILIFGLILFPFVQERITTFSASAATGSTELLNPFIQVPTVLGTYIGLIFWPFRLTIYHLDELGVQTIPLILNTILLVGYGASLVFCYLRNKKIFFFLSLFFIASLPALIPIHIIQIAAERYAYMGTAGLIIATVAGLFSVLKRYSVSKKVLTVLLLTCVVTLGWQTHLRALDWESEMSLRLATLRTAPYSARAHNNVGIQLMNEGSDEAALAKFKKSISLKPDYSHPYHNIGHLLAVRGRYEEAVPYYLKAMSLNSFEWKTHQDLGQVYFMLKKYPEAREQLNRAIDQGSPEAERLGAILNRIEELGY